MGMYSTKIETQTWPVEAPGYLKDIWGQNKPRTEVYLWCKYKVNKIILNN